MPPAALARERILLIGDHDRHLAAALGGAVPSADVIPVEGVFDGLAELTGGGYSTVLAAAEPIERRPEAAVRALRELLPQGRLLLFGHPTLEPLSRKMLEFGVDDYVVTPASASELQQMFGLPQLRIAAPPAGDAADAAEAPPIGPLIESLPLGDRVAMLLGLPLADILLDALQSAPRNALGAAVRAIDLRIAPELRLTHSTADAPAPPAPEGSVTLSHTVWIDKAEKAALHLSIRRDDDASAARHFLAQLAHLSSRLLALQERHTGLEQLAITDDLTGLYNGRYFRSYLRSICEKARREIFLVTLLMFDLDNFKQYNDEFGHALGDEILRQTAALMKKCVRPHDRVFRIAGDEFAVVFFEKDPPRTPHDPSAATGQRAIASVTPLLDRFRRTLATPEFANLGAAGKGTLTISGGLAIFPHHANTPEDLIDAADRALMFGAKRGGKNSIYLVGGERS